MISKNSELYAQQVASSSSEIFSTPLVLTTILAIIAIFAYSIYKLVKNRTKRRSISLTSSVQEVEKPSVDKKSDLAPEISEILNDDPQSWLSRLRSSLSKTRQQMNLSRLFGGSSTLNKQLLEEIHETLYRSDMGVDTADRLVGALKKRLPASENVRWEDVSLALQEEVKDVLSREHKPLNTPSQGPLVILVVGVNGVGKTTSIGKLAARFLSEGKSVLLCAADTFRAAAIEQLQVWGERINAPVIKQQQGADPASVAFDGVKAALSRQVDVLLIDTAGRLHSKVELMDELAKVKRVISRELPGAPHETWLVIDATTGQNAVQQVKAFQEIVQLTGLIVTKLDRTAKGGVLIGICNQFQLPIRYVGIGERAADLKEFSPKEYAESIFS